MKLQYAIVERIEELRRKHYMTSKDYSRQVACHQQQFGQSQIKEIVW